MSVSQERLRDASGETGFRAEALEKVIRLGELASDVFSHPFLGPAPEVGLARGSADVDADVEAVGAVAAGDRGLRRRTRRTTIRRFRTVRRGGAREVTRLIDHYSLAAILAVG